MQRGYRGTSPRYSTVFKATNADDDNLKQQYMKLTTLTTITRWILCIIAAAIAVGALRHNPGHLFTAAMVFAVGLNVEWKEKED